MLPLQATKKGWRKVLALPLHYLLASLSACQCSIAAQGIADVMPPVFAIESTPESRSTEQFPAPLNEQPLPPMIIFEKGESLDEFVARKHPDYFTAIQVRLHVSVQEGSASILVSRTEVT